MPEYSGSLSSFELTFALWLVPVIPLVAAAVCALWRTKNARIGTVAMVGTAAPLLVLVWKALELAGAPADRRTLVEAPWTLLRIGSLDVSFGLALDPIALVVGIAASVAALAIVLELERRGAAPRRELGGACLALGCLLLTALADNLFVLVLGWQGLALATYVLAGDRLELREERPAWASAVLSWLPLSALLAASVLLLWGLGGIWTTDGDYVPDFHARLVHVSPARDSRASKSERVDNLRSGRGALTIAALPGSKIELAGGELCAIDERGEPGGVASSSRPCRKRAVTPFARLPVPVALHDIRVSPGPGTNDLMIEKVRIARGTESRIVLTGPTLVFREMEQQLSIRDVSGVYPLRAALTQKKLWGMPLLALVAVLLVGAALLRALAAVAASSAAPAGAVLIAGFGGSAATLLVIRTSSVLAHAPRVTSVLAMLAALAAVVAALRALHQKKLVPLVTLAVGAQLLLAISGAMFGAGSGAGVHVAVHLLAAAALLLAASARSRAFVFGAMAAAAAPLPLVGAFWSRDLTLWTAFITSEGVLIPGWVTYLLGLLASTAVAYALWRAHFRASAKTPATDARAPLVAGALALAIGLLLVPLGDPVAQYPGEWAFGPPRDPPPIDPALRYGSLLIAFGLPLGAWLAARRRAGAREEQLPGAALFGQQPSGRWALGFATGLERAARAVVAIDRRVENALGRKGDGP